MIFDEWIQNGRTFTKENSASILTGVGVAGTITTAYLTGRASIKAMDLIREEETNVRRSGDGIGGLSRRDKAQLVWPIFLPSVAAGTLTVTSIVLANREASKKTAALAAAYGLSERALAEYRDKVVEQLGKTKEQAVRDSIAQDRVANKPVSQVIITGKGDVLCYDGVTGRYFESNVESIKKAMNDINYRIMNHGYESLSAFYDLIGLPATSYSDEVGWNSNELMDISFSTTLSTDDRPCIAIDFTVAPTHGYERMY